MGQYFKIVNPAKKQYLDAGRFNENIKASGILCGNHAIAVALLVCNLDQVRDGWGSLRHDYGPMAGSWCGDPINVVGDDHTKPDAFGIKTSTEETPERNLCWMAEEEFEDISYKAIAMLCEGRKDIAEDMVERAASSAEMALVNLGNVVFYVGCKPLEEALEKHYGDEWVKKYRDAWVKHPR